MPKGIYTRSKEQNRKISESMMGHPVSEETRRKMSAKRKAYWDRLRAENRMPNWKKKKKRKEEVTRDMKTMTKEQLHQWIENGPEKPSDEKPAYTWKDREDFERMVNNLANALSCLKDSPLINDKGVAFYFNKIASSIIPMKVLGSQALGRLEGAE